MHSKESVWERRRNLEFGGIKLGWQLMVRPKSEMMMGLSFSFSLLLSFLGIFIFIFVLLAFAIPLSSTPSCLKLSRKLSGLMSAWMISFWWSFWRILSKWWVKNAVMESLSLELRLEVLEWSLWLMRSKRVPLL